MSTSTWTGAVSSDWADAGNWSPAGIPVASSDVTIASGTPVALASASIGTVNSITDSSYLSFGSAGTNAVATFLDDAGHLYVDAKEGDGGTILNIGGALTSHYLSIGNASLAAPDEVTAASLDNTGKIYLDGSSADQALLDVAGSAGFGTAGVLSGYVRLAGDTAIAFASGEITSLAAGAHLGLIGNQAFIEDSTALGSNSALAGLASIGDGALFALHDGAAVSTTGALANDGNVYLDTEGGDGGSSLTVAGALTNSQELGIGNASLSALDEVTATSLDNTGKIQLTGSSANQALVDVTAGSAGFGAAGILSGHVRLAGDSAIEFASGQITSLAANAQLHLNGNDAFIEDSTATGSNSALTGLALIGAGAIFGLHNKAAVSTGALVNDGTIRLDIVGGDGGSSLRVAGALTNNGTLDIGNAKLSASDKVTAASLDNTGANERAIVELAGSSANQALLDVTTGVAGFGAAGVLSGDVSLEGNSAIEFASGQITSLAASAYFSLGGNDAFIEDSTALGSNSALTGLASIVAGQLFLYNGASLSTTGGLANDLGIVYLDNNAGEGGSSLTVAGTLTNGGDLYIGNAGLSASDTVTAASLDNPGRISLQGSSANQALLDVTAGSAGFGAAGVLSSHVRLVGDSAVEFGSGQITSLSGVEASLLLDGKDAFIEDSTATGSNSALTGLASIGAGATFNLENQAAVSTTGALANDGTVSIDANYDGHGGGSTLTLAGALTNSGQLGIGPPGAALSASDKVMAASLDNTGQIELVGSDSNQYQALLDVTAGSAGFGTAGTLTGSVELFQDSAVEFLSGQISTIAASSELSLQGNSAFIEDSTALGSNSALTGLADIEGSLSLGDRASVSTTGALVNSGNIGVGGGSTGATLLNVAGTLTNTGSLSISGDSVTAKSFVTSGTVYLTGATGLGALNVSGALTNNGAISMSQNSDLNVSGATTNNGSISISNDAELAGAVGGAGSFSLTGGADLQFDSSVSSGQTINETGADALTLNEAQSFAATISGFGTGGTIDATNFVETGTTYNFVENIAGTGGTLTLHDASLTANILMTGDYSKSSFTLAPDSGTGTLVKFV